MTNNHTYWIRHKNKKYVVQKIIDGKQKQIADFPSRAQAKKYVTKHTVAAHLEKVVDKEYSFHELLAERSCRNLLISFLIKDLTNTFIKLLILFLLI